MSRNGSHFIEQAIGKISDVREAKNALAQRFIHAPRAEAAIRTPTAFAATARAVTAPISPAPIHNVVGVGVGEKVSDGKQTGALAVKLLVRLKYPQSELDSKPLLPPDIDGIPTSVEEVGTIRKSTTVAGLRKPTGVGNHRAKRH